MKKLFWVLLMGLSSGLFANTDDIVQDNPQEVIVMTVTHKDGSETKFYWHLDADNAPNHVARFKELIRENFYNNAENKMKFHRVIADFMAQSGDPLGNGTGGSGQTINSEFTDKPFKLGSIGAARSNDPDSADSQWFICHADDSCAHLNGQYTHLGYVSLEKEGSAMNKTLQRLLSEIQQDDLMTLAFESM
ncbi:MAG: peptidylprolyl isomerase [Candidatus Comchoanobacterales bacterium]